MSWAGLSPRECPACSGPGERAAAAVYMSLAWETRTDLTHEWEVAAYARNVLEAIGPGAAIQFACGLRRRGSRCSASDCAWALGLAEACEAAAEKRRGLKLAQLVTDLTDCRCPALYLSRRCP